jgi:hypothetical protein
MFVNLGDKYAGSGGHNNAGVSGGPSQLQGASQRRVPVERAARSIEVAPESRENSHATRRSAPDRYNQATNAPAKSLMLLPERYRIGCVDQLGLIARAVIVWDKPNGLPESVTDRVRRSHEDWVHLTKAPRYYAAVDEIREPQLATGGTAPEGRHAAASGNGVAHRTYQPNAYHNPLGKLPGSVWRIPTNPLEELWQAIATGEIRFCPKCGRDLAAGSGPATPIRLVTGEPSAPTAPSSTSTASPTSCGSDPSPTGSPSTTSAATGPAATPPTSKSSPDERTSNGAVSPSKPTASTATPSPTPTSTDEPTAVSAGSVVRVRSTDSCVCEQLGALAPSSVWTVPSEPLRVPEHIGVDHYAAFPQELPRRIILGWTPPGHCTECGQARTAVVEKAYTKLWNHTPSSHMTDNQDNNLETFSARGRGYNETTITGYSCACPTPNAPTRPAVVLDPFAGTGTTVMVARALGRYGVGVDLSADYLRLARWRIYQSGHSAKTMNRTWTERQGSLL